MNYKQKYKAALERARMINNGEDVDIKAGTTTCEYIFPELKKSKDEKIREMLIKFFSNGLDYASSTNGIPDKDIVVWLEKQKEKKI